MSRTSAALTSIQELSAEDCAAATRWSRAAIFSRTEDWPNAREHARRLTPRLTRTAAARGRRIVNSLILGSLRRGRSSCRLYYTKRGRARQGKIWRNQTASEPSVLQERGCLSQKQFQLVVVHPVSRVRHLHHAAIPYGLQPRVRFREGSKTFEAPE